MTPTPSGASFLCTLCITTTPGVHILYIYRIVLTAPLSQKFQNGGKTTGIFTKWATMSKILNYTIKI